MEVALLLLGTRLQVPSPKKLLKKVPLHSILFKALLKKFYFSAHVLRSHFPDKRNCMCSNMYSKKLYFVIFWNICDYETNLLFIQNRKQGIHFFSTLWTVFCWKLSLSYVAPFLFLFVLEFWTNHVLLDVAHKRNFNLKETLSFPSVFGRCGTDLGLGTRFTAGTTTPSMI